MIKGWHVALGATALTVFGGMACSGSGKGDGEAPGATASRATAQSVAQGGGRPPTEPNHFAGPPDVSRSVVRHGPRVAVASPHASLPLRDLPDAVPVEEPFDHEPGRNPFPFTPHLGADQVLQATLPIVEMPVAVQSFLGQGSTLGHCIFPKPDAGEPAGCTTRGDPPDTVGAVGPKHYVQLVNSGIGIWNKNGTLAQAPKFTSALFTGMPTTDGNNCGTPPPKGDFGDGVVLYDQMADRWVITQFDLTNYVNNKPGPSYQCVAVSQTADPTGAYWLYDFQYTAPLNDYGKFSVWPDAYYASYNDFDQFFLEANVCAWDRVSMLQGKPATEQCFTNPSFSLLPSSVDGAIKPPNGTPAFFVTLGSGASFDLYTFHVDFAAPGNSALTGPTTLPVAAYNPLCNGGACVAQPAPGNPLASLGDRAMFHLSYRNFGTVESLVFNHSVDTANAGGIRWYEIRSPAGTPVVFQQGTYAPADAPGENRFRWMGSIAQDQAQDIALGFAISSSTSVPSVAWTGRTAADPAGAMGQAETVIETGVGVETGTFPGTTKLANRWGDYSNMTVDPTDDCTFWYTQEIFPANGMFNWDTHVSSVTFPGCAKNDFSIGASPASKTVAPGATAAYTVTTASTRGSAETIALNIQDLPTGVSAAFVPATVSAGATSTLTLTATAAAPVTATPDTFTVIGKAPSAVHAATAQVSVSTGCVKLTTCPAPDNCGTISDGCGGTLSCGGACAPLDACHLAGTCTANVCSQPVAPDGTGCNDGNACTTTDVCASGTCKGTAVVCTNGDACHDPGTCQAAGGACSAPVPKANGTPCSVGTCQGGACTPTVVDAGSDSGSDAGGDSGTAGDDSGVDASVDSGTGTGDDSGGPIADSGTVNLGDASASPDSGAPGIDGGTADGGGGGTGQGGGCGCRTAPSKDGSSLPLLGLGALGFATVLRRRRRARPVS